MLRFTDRLLEEEPDFAALSTMAFDSPGPAPAQPVWTRLADGGSPTKKGLGTTSDGDILGEAKVHEGEGDNAEEDLHDQSMSVEAKLDPPHELENSVFGAPEVEEEEDLDDEMTVILPKAPLSVPDNLLPSSAAESQPQTTPSPAEGQLPPGSASKVTKVHVTPRLRSIVASVISSCFLPFLLKRHCTVDSDMEYCWRYPSAW